MPIGPSAGAWRASPAVSARTPDGTFAFDRRSAAIINQSAETVHAIFDGLTQAAPGWLSTYLAGEGGVARCLITSEVDPRRKLNYRDRLAQSGIHDGINILSMDLDRRGLLLSLGIPAGPTIAPEKRTDLVRAATHIQSALRLRARLAAESLDAPAADDGLESGDAVLTAEGKLLHAEGDATLANARRALQTAVRDMTHARIALRGDAHRALGMWKGLVAAQWTLIDRFESNGERYVVARENTPQLNGLVALTPDRALCRGLCRPRFHDQRNRLHAGHKRHHRARPAHARSPSLRRAQPRSPARARPSRPIRDALTGR